MAETATTPARTLTPYDTGLRGEPKVWDVRSIVPDAPIGGALDEGRYGMVDYDGDDGETLVTVWVERNSAGEYVVHIQEHTAEVLVKVHS